MPVLRLLCRTGTRSPHQWRNRSVSTSGQASLSPVCPRASPWPLQYACKEGNKPALSPLEPLLRERTSSHPPCQVNSHTMTLGTRQKIQKFNLFYLGSPECDSWHLYNPQHITKYSRFP